MKTAKTEFMSKHLNIVLHVLSSSTSDKLVTQCGIFFNNKLPYLPAFWRMCLCSNYDEPCFKMIALFVFNAKYSSLSCTEAHTDTRHVHSCSRAANLKSRLGVFETTKKRIFSFFGVLPDLNFLTIL